MPLIQRPTRPVAVTPDPPRPKTTQPTAKSTSSSVTQFGNLPATQRFRQKNSNSKPVPCQRPRKPSPAETCLSTSIFRDLSPAATFDCSSQDDGSSRSTITGRSSRLSQKLPRKNDLRSRTRTISRQSAGSREFFLQERIRNLETENDELRRQNLLLLAGPDPYGPCRARATGDVMADMKMQITVNRLRVELLEKQIGQLGRTLEQMKMEKNGKSCVDSDGSGGAERDFMVASMVSHSRTVLSEEVPTDSRLFSVSS